MTDDVQSARTELVWPTVAMGDPRRRAPRRPGLDPGPAPPREPAVPRPSVRQAARRQCQRVALTRPPWPARSPSRSARCRARRSTPLIAIADAEIARLKTEGPTEEELAKVKNQVENRAVLSLQTVQAKSDFFNRNYVQTGDPLGYKKELRAAYAVTAADVKRVANKYLTANRIRLDVNPGPKTPRPEETPVDRSTQTPLAKVEAVPVKDSFDRSSEPKPGANPAFTPAPVVRRRLSNGLEVLIGERHNLPVVGLNLVVKGGGTLVPPGKEGLASFTGDLLTEGTTSRSALQLANELSELGASINGGGGPESCNLSLTTLTRNLPRALDIYTDVLLHPTFPTRDLERLRTQRLTALNRQVDSPPTIAGLVFPKLLYGEDHPYGRPNTGTPKSIKGLTRDDLVNFYKTMFVPNNAALVVVGDITPDGIIPVLESALKDWKPGSPVVQTPTDAPAAPKGLTVYLIDKPKAAQSILAVGQVGVARSNPDYFPLTIMNAVLGGQFTSRINMNLREDKGYTYGARSSFNFAKGPGPFEANAPVDTKFTKPALVELMKELTDIAGSRPATVQEIADAKDRLVKGFPARFESIGGGGGRRGGGGGGGLGGTLAELVTYDLPNDYFTTYRDKVEAVTPADVQRVAQKYLDASKMTILIVGDREVVEPALKELPFVKEITLLDADGHPVSSNPKK